MIYIGKVDSTMKKRLLSLLLSLCLIFTMIPAVMAAEPPTMTQVYDAMIAFKATHPEGTEWTNDNLYNWKGYAPQNGVYWSGGYGCVGFAFMLSDAAFGKLPARELTNITIDDVRPGDVLRINGNSHSVIVLEVHKDHVIIAEGNYMGTVHWGRKLTASQVAEADYMLTRYPDDYPQGLTLTGWRKAYYDMIQEKNLTNQNEAWAVAGYSLIDINGDEYPELWIDSGIYATGCAFAFISDRGLSFQHFQHSSLSYVEGANLFSMAGGIQGAYWEAVYRLENGKISPTSQTLGSGKKLASENALPYEEFLDLLYELEAQYGPEGGIPSLPVFSDVIPGSFYETAVAWAVENGITKGRDEVTFAPNDFCKRSEVVTFLHRSQGLPAPASTQTGFTDVELGKFYTDAVAWAVENGITNGMGDGTFGVTGSCTRGQVVTFLWRAAGSPEPFYYWCPFTDVNPNAYYYKAVLWAVDSGITNGISDTAFGPDTTCTRGQIVTFLHRFAG